MTSIYKSLSIGAMRMLIPPLLVYGFVNFSAGLNQINEVQNNGRTIEKAGSIWRGRSLEVVSDLTSPGINLANYVIKEFELNQK